MMESTALTINQRILELVEAKGGPSEVARQMGVSPQFFYNLKNRPDSKPNSDPLEKFFKVLPRANANYIYKGVGPQWLDAGSDNTGLDTSKNNSVDGTGEWRVHFEQLEVKYNTVVAQLTQVLETNDLLKKLIKNLDPSFSMVASLNTAFTAINQIGFHAKHPECKVMALPVNQGNVRKFTPRPVERKMLA